MKQYTKLARRASFLCFVLLLFGWLFYYLYLYHYLPAHITFDYIYSFVRTLLLIIPILIIILWLILLAIKKPKFKRLNTNLILFLTILFFLNLCIAIYSSKDYLITGQYSILNLSIQNKHHYVSIQMKDSEFLLECRNKFYQKLKLGQTYQISFRGNEFTKRFPPTIISIDPCN